MGNAHRPARTAHASTEPGTVGRFWAAAPVTVLLAALGILPLVAAAYVGRTTIKEARAAR